MCTFTASKCASFRVVEGVEVVVLCVVAVVIVILGVAERAAASDCSKSAWLGAPLSASGSPTGSTRQLGYSSLLEGIKINLNDAEEI